MQKSNVIKLLVGFVCGLLIAIAVAAVLGVFSHEPELSVVVDSSVEGTESENVEEADEIEEIVEMPATIEGPGFDTPEEAIIAYVEAMKSGDINQMLSTFAIETYVDNYDVKAAVEKAGGYSSATNPPFLSIDAYTRYINIYRREDSLTKALLEQYFYFADMTDYYRALTLTRDCYGYGSPENFFDALQDEDWMNTLANMKYGEVKTAEDLRALLSEDYFSESSQNSIDNTMKLLGCDELVPLAIEVEFDGKEYYLSMNVICYDGRWYNYVPGGTIAWFIKTDVDAAAGGFIER